MKFSLLSDMHVDFPQEEVLYELLEKVVVVAGDTSNGFEGLRFLNKLVNKGHTVVAVDGNHEHYRNAREGRSAEETTARFREAFPSRIEQDKIPFVFRNGWYIVENEALWKNYMNDSKASGMSREVVNKRATDDAYYVEQALQHWKDCQLKGVVVTHTSPTLATLNPQYEGHYSNEWYYNPLMGDLLKEYQEQILVWCHGHTHAAADKIVDGVRVVCNPRGYPGENPTWKPLTVEI